MPAEDRLKLGDSGPVWLRGLRRGDAVRLGRAHTRDGIATIKTEKSGFTVTVTLPISPALAATLAAGPCGDLTFITGESGRPLTKESFGNEFRKACRAAGVPGSAHGVRNIAAEPNALAGRNRPTPLISRHILLSPHSEPRPFFACWVFDA